MKTTKTVSPYLRRPLRSLQEVVQALRKEDAAASSAYGTTDAQPPLALNNNTPAARRPARRLGAKSA